MIITVGNTKGGVGKTTLAVQIAIARALAGRDVWLIDGDRQGTAAAAIAARKAGASLVSCACVPLDCSISVSRNMPLLGSFAEGLPGSSRIDSVQAGSRAGPVGETGTDGPTARWDGVAGIGGGMT